MRRAALRRASALVLSTAALLGAAAVCAPAASADPITQLKEQGAPYVVYLVKDLGGGAYWNVTTSSLYVVTTAGTTLVTAVATGADLLATTAANGRDLLLLINGAVLTKVEGALQG